VTRTKCSSLCRFSKTLEALTTYSLQNIMALSFILAILLLQLCRHASALVVTPIRPEQPMVSSRRGFFHSSAAFTLNPLVLVVATVPANSYASDASSSLINELVESKAKLKPIPGLLEQQEWEQVRQILKKPPVNKLWNLGDVRYRAISYECCAPLVCSRLSSHLLLNFLYSSTLQVTKYTVETGTRHWRSRHV
jgi:hypothetical protein